MRENELKGNIIATVTDIDTEAEGESVIIQAQDVCDSIVILDVNQPNYVLYVSATVTSVCVGYTLLTSDIDGDRVSYTVYLDGGDIDSLTGTTLMHIGDGVDIPIIDIQRDSVTGAYVVTTSPLCTLDLCISSERA